MVATGTLYFRLYDVFKAVEASQRLVGVPHYWGKIEQAPVRATPHVLWRPAGREAWKPPALTNWPAVLPGPDGANRNVLVSAIHTREAAALISLYADPDAIENLLTRYAYALRDVLLVEARYSLDGDWQAREQLSTATDMYTLTLRTLLPVADQVPYALPTGEHISLRPTP